MKSPDNFAAPFTTDQTEKLKVQDWSESLTQISKAFRDLEDALPAGDKEKTLDAFVRLRRGQEALGDFLSLKQVLQDVSENAEEPTV